MTLNLKKPYVILLISFIVLGVYYSAIFSPFTSIDDRKLIDWLMNAEDIRIRDFLFGGGSYYRPLVLLTFYADRVLWGLDSGFMHLENVVLHLFNALLVYSLAVAVFRPLDPKNHVLSSLTAALLFALHPLNTEAVNWVSGRTDVLACFFVMSSLLLLWKGTETLSLPYVAGGSVLFLFGALTKETALFFLPAAIVVIITRMKRSDSGWLKPTVSIMLFVAAVVVYFKMRVTGSGSGGAIRSAVSSVASTDAGIWFKVLAMLKMTGFYSWKLIFPFPLNFAITKIPNLFAVPGVLVLCCCLWWVIRRTQTSLLFLTTASIGMSAIVIAFSNIAWTPVAERYMYIPSAVFCLAMVAAYQQIRKNIPPKATFAATALILVSATTATASRNLVWQDNYLLFSDTVSKSPTFSPAKNDLALALYGKGKKDEAHKLFEENFDKNNDNELARLNKAVVLLNTGKAGEARQLLLDGLKNPQKIEIMLRKKLVYVDERLLLEEKSPERQVHLKVEMAENCLQLKKLTGDSFFGYRAGLFFASAGNREAARGLLAEAYAKAPKTSHYREPAKKILEKLTE